MSQENHGPSEARASAKDAARADHQVPVQETLAEARRRCLQRVIGELGLPPGYQLPEPYELDESGVHDQKAGRVISAPLVLTRVLIDPGGAHMVEVAWRDRGRWVRRVVPRSAIVNGKTMVTALADAGLPVIASRAAVAERYLAALESANRAVLEPELVGRWLGWQDDGIFVHAPGKPRQIEPAYTVQGPWMAAHCERGTMSGWQDVVKPLVAYPVAQMVLCAGFTAALLDVLQLDSHTVDVSGRSTRGKTTVAKIAFSVWGDPSERGDGIFSWRTSDIAAEQRLNVVRGIPVIFDETRVAKSHELVDRILYQVPKNHGQARGGGWPSLLPWQTVVISTGEQSALSFTTYQGAAARVLSVTRPPFPAGGTSAPDVRAVGNGILDHHGHAGPAFVHALSLVQAGDGAALIRERHQDLTRQVEGTGDMSGRRAPALAAHVLAGQLAYEWRLLPFEPPSSAEWLDAFQAEDETDDRGEMALNIVREYVVSNGQALWRAGPIPRTQPSGGWIGRLYDHDGQPTVALLPQKLTEVLDRAGYSLAAVQPSWKENGVILRLGGPTDRTPWLPSRLCGPAKARMYVFAPGTIEVGGGDAE